MSRAAPIPMSAVGQKPRLTARKKLFAGLVMLFCAGAIFFAVFLVATNRTEKPPVEPETELARELKSLQGTWRMVHGDWGGVPLTQEELEQRLLTHTGEKYVMTVGKDIWSEGTITLDVSKNPKRAEALETKGRSPIKRELSIYLVVDDLLIVCASYSKPEYPARFTADEGFCLAVYKREKPGQVTVQAKERLAKAKEELATQELKSLQGTWRMVYGEWGGVPLTQEETQGRAVTHTGNKYVVTLGKDVWSEGTFTLDVTKNPKRKETVEIKGQGSGRPEAIYVVADDILIVCASHSKPGYPDRFTAAEGFWLAVYKREEPARDEKPKE